MCGFFISNINCKCIDGILFFRYKRKWANWQLHPVNSWRRACLKNASRVLGITYAYYLTDGWLIGCVPESAGGRGRSNLFFFRSLCAEPSRQHVSFFLADMFMDYSWDFVLSFTFLLWTFTVAYSFFSNVIAVGTAGEGKTCTRVYSDPEQLGLL